MQVQAIVTRIQTRVDGGVAVTVVTNELDPAEFGLLYQYLNKFCTVTIEEEDEAIGIATDDFISDEGDVDQSALK